MSIHLDHETLGATVVQPGPAYLPQVVPPSKPARLMQATGQVFSTIIRTTAFVAIGGVCFIAAAERLAPLEWRPSTLIGAFSGREESARVLTAITARRAEVAMQQEEAARAQQEVIVIQAENERVTQAYAALFQRGNALAQTWAEGAKQALLIDANGRLQALQGRSEVSGIKDKLAMWCDIGGLFSPDLACGDALRGSARNDRDAMTAEIISNYKAQSRAIASSLQDWSNGLPDAAQLVAYKTKIERLYPLPRAPIPPAPVPVDRL